MMIFGYFVLPASANAPYHIGICTETVSQAEDDLRGAERAIR
ncbi:MAG: DUF3798 domain-containing protein, partial [Acetomicrobium flavidum]|nr:DUF3798 domain-containing protein [Acetomicrobium flavidum]